MVCTVVYLPNKGLFFFYSAYFLIERLILLQCFYSYTGLFYYTLMYFLTQWFTLLPISLFSCTVVYFLRVWFILFPAVYFISQQLIFLHNSSLSTIDLLTKIVCYLTKGKKMLQYEKQLIWTG
jgi:hypothetical protein